MKKFLSALLAVVMVVAMLPAGIAFAADGDNADIVFDFDAAERNAREAWQEAGNTAWTGMSSLFSVDPILSAALPEGIVPNQTLGQTYDKIAWQKGAGIRFCNHTGNWLTNNTTSTAKPNRVAFDIEISEDQAGWYRPSVDIFSRDGNAEYSVYVISNAGIQYAGDVVTTNEQEGKNPVYFKAGTNTFVMAVYYSEKPNEMTTYIQSITLHAVNATLPVDTDSVEAPATLQTGATGSVDATGFKLSDGSEYIFAEYAMNADGTCAGASTVDYMDVTSSDPYIAAVTKVDAVTHTVSAISAGTVTLTVTPVVGGVKQTAMATTKTLNVTGDILIDAGALDLKTYENIMAAEGHPTYWKADTTNGQDWGWNKRRDSTMGIETAVNADWDANPTRARRVALDVTVPEDGWYLPSYKADAEDPLKASVYSVVDGSSFYLGDLDLTGTVHETGSPVVFNPVYLKSGDFANKFYFNFREGTNGANFYFNEFKLTKLNAAPTATELKTNIPVLSINEEIALTAKVELSTGESLNFENAMVSSNGGKVINPASFKDYMTITSDNASVVKVSGVSASEFMNAQNYKYTLTALKSGTANITFTPYVAGVAQTPIVKKVTVSHPNAEITDNSVSIALTAIVDSVVSPDAKLLLSESTVTAGNVNSVTIGSTVTLRAADSETLKFLYWYNGNSKRILSDEKEYSFIAGTNTPVFARYANTNALLEEYFTAAGQLTEGNSEDFELKVDRSYYKLYKEKTAAPVAATTVNDATAVYWTKEGKIVSYNTSYTFIPWGNATEAVAVKEGVKSDVPAVVLFTSGNSYMLELVNFEGKTIIEKGILFGGDLTISHCEEKAVARDNTNQFTATGEGEARAYVIYRDGATIRVAYSK